MMGSMLRGECRPRPMALPGRTVQLDTPCGRLYATINHDPDSGLPVELFCRFGKSGTCGSAIMDGMARIISCGLRAGLPPQVVVRALAGISCCQGVRSCMDSLAEAFREEIGEPPEGRR